MLGGGPGDVGGPPSAAAITQALHWLSPPHGTILHVRSVETMGGRTTTRESWQLADDPTSERVRIDDGGQSFEFAGDALYDPSSNTIYDPPNDAGKKPQDFPLASAPPPGKDGKALPAGDPAVDKVRILLQRGDMDVTGRETHNGTEAWAISLKADFGRPVWTLWVSAADGKPLELRDPGRDASEAPQVIRWPTYEVVPAASGAQLLTLTGAHPSARVVHDAAQAAAAEQRLMPGKP
jgi:hypothetical protein